jgi:PAS domain S-box-containing protein
VRIVNAPGEKTPEDVANEIIISLNQAGEWQGEVHNLRKDGTSFWCDVHVSTFKHPQYGKMWIAVHQDITNRKQVEEALKEMEVQYRNLFENANEAIFVAQDGWLVFLNPMSTMMIGYSGKELMAKPFTEFIHPDDREMVINRHSRRMKGVEIPFPYSFQIIHKDGNSKWVEVNAVLINWKGKPATLNFLSDITDRKRAEEVLRKRDIQFKKLSSWVPGMIYQFTKRPDGTYCMPFTTEAIKDIFGCSPQSTIMNSPADKKLSVASAWHR